MGTSFFYGTLMHPGILKRVICNDGSHLHIGPAVLLEHTRHHVRCASYPGVVPYEKSKPYFDRDLSRDERCVRGSLVTGLTEKDMKLLDFFEGSEYVKAQVQVYALSRLIPLPTYTLPTAQHPRSPSEDLIPDVLPPLPEILSDPIDAKVYIFRDVKALDMKQGLWTFEQFAQTHAADWMGGKEELEEGDKVWQRLEEQAREQGI